MPSLVLPVVLTAGIVTKISPFAGICVAVVNANVKVPDCVATTKAVDSNVDESAVVVLKFVVSIILATV